MDHHEMGELLVRIDERVKALKDGDEGDIPQIVKHLEMLNNQVTKNTIFRVTLLRVFTGIGSALAVGGLTFLGLRLAGV